jgi:hypothetical protein
MNRATVGTVLESLLTNHSASSLLEIEHQGTGDTNAPAFETAVTGHEALLLHLNARQRQSRAEAYSHPVTHEAYCEDTADLEIGCRVRETHRKAEGGTWEAVPREQQVRCTVLGKERIPGLPEPHGQVRLDLNQVSASR